MELPGVSAGSTAEVIAWLTAHEILDCYGRPTIRVTVGLENGGTGRADVPAGRSTGHHEASELRDGGTRFGGNGVRQAVAAVEDEIASELKGFSGDQRELDRLLIALDGTSDKSRLGANALLGISLAYADARASANGVSLYRYLNPNAYVLPVPQVNLVNGGKHASNDLDFQEFMIVPVGAATFMGAMELVADVNGVLGDLLLSRYGKTAINLGIEGGYAPPISDPEEALSLLHEAVRATGHTDQIRYGLDCAATHLYEVETGTYTVNGESLKREQMIELYARLVHEYDVVTIEDPLHEEDFAGFADLTAALDIQIVGDDLFATNPKRVAYGVQEKAANALLWKVNQIGTLSEAWDAATLAAHSGLAVIPSERSGETESPMLADLTVALGAGQIKTGAPVGGERTAKYNRLIEIEGDLGRIARYAGTHFRMPALLVAP